MSAATARDARFTSTKKPALCRACGCSPCNNPAFCAMCRKVDAETAVVVRELNDNHAAPQVILEALAYQLRDGVGALREPSAQRRLAQLDERQMREIANRLTKPRWGKSKAGEMPPKVSAWRPTEIETLVEMWRDSQ